MNPDNFFASIRKSLFVSLRQTQVDGINAVLTATDGLQVTWRAYILATVYRETAATMQPIEEYGHGKGRAYGVPVGPWHQVYDGRGDVQLTWEANYIHADQRLHALGVMKPEESLDRNPELALRPDISALILVHGMVEGWFTGKKLADYLPGDYRHARQIINGMDVADLIAGYAVKFEAALAA